MTDLHLIVLSQTQIAPSRDLWLFLPVGYLLTIMIETPILMIGLSNRLDVRQKVLCGIWLTACTYPIVVLVLPTLFYGLPRWQYLLVAETFAPAAECLIFWIAYLRKGLLSAGQWTRCFGAIITANLVSFISGEVLNLYGWFGLF